MASFDIADLETSTKSEAGVAMEVINPKTLTPMFDDDGNPITITLLGRNSEPYMEEERRMRDRRSDRVARGIKITQDDVDRDEALLLTAATTNWTFDKIDGSPFPCTRPNALKLWSDKRFRWLRERSISFVLSDGNFLGK